MKCAILLVLVAVFSHCKAQCVGSDGNTYQPGESYRSLDCYMCSCLAGNKMMTCVSTVIEGLVCARPLCTNPSYVNIEGRCCPGCYGPDAWSTPVDTSS